MSARAQSSSRPLRLDAYPRPPQDNGRGMHWIPTTSSSPEVVDRYVEEARRMGVKWMVFLNQGTSVNQNNDYLVRRLSEAGIEPVMRVYTPAVDPIKGDLEGMVRHYTQLGVRYFQPFNEPNLRVEYADGRPSVDRYLDAWVPAARAIVRGGGLPGFGSLAPGGDLNDLQFLRQAVRTLKDRGELGTLDRAWLSAHNYAQNHPLAVASADEAQANGFTRVRAYQTVLRATLGRELPVVGTEGGAFAGDRSDPTRPALDEKAAVNTVKGAYEYMRDRREPWNLAYSYWVIANQAGGGTDPRWDRYALFRADGSTSELVPVLRGLA